MSAPAATGYDVVMVCGGGPCSQHTEQVIDDLRGVVRAAPEAVLMRTGCLAGCAGRPAGAGPQAGCEVVAQRVDVEFRATAPGCRLGLGARGEIVREVARWLLRCG